MNNAQLNELKDKYVAKGAASPATAFADRAKNAELWDADGNRFIDFAGGIGVLNIGHCHPKVVQAVKDQLDKVMHTCQTVMPYEGYVKVAEKLAAITEVSKARDLFCVLTCACSVVGNVDWRVMHVQWYAYALHCLSLLRVNTHQLCYHSDVGVVNCCRAE